MTNYTNIRPEFKKYKVFMSHGNDIAIDEDELDLILNGIKAGQPVKVRQGIFNPSFFVSIGLDTKRYDNWKEGIKYVGFGDEAKTYYPVLENLPNIFNGILEAPKVKVLSK